MRNARFHGARIALALAVALLTYVFFPAAPAVDFPLLEVGSVAPENVSAPFAYTVPKTEAELAKEREDLARSVEPIFAYAPQGTDSARVEIDALRSAVDGALAATANRGDADRAAAVQRAAGSVGLQLTAPEAIYLAQPGRDEAVADALRRAVDRWLVAGVAASGALDNIMGTVTLRRGAQQRSILGDSILTFSSFVSRARLVHPDIGSPVGDAVFRKALASIFHPTVVYDRIGTERAREALRRSVAPAKYQLRAGEKIVGAHEVVGPAEHDKMRALRDVLESRTIARSSVSRVAGAVLFNALIVAIFGITLLLFRPQLYASMRALLVIAGAFVVVIAAASIIARAPGELHPELIPVAFAAVILSVLFDARISLIAAMVLSALIGGQSDFRGTNALFLNLIGGTAAAFTVRMVRRRNQTYYSMLAIGGAYILAALAIGMTLDWPVREIAHSAGWGVINAVVSVAVAMAIVPVAEELTRIDTYLKLLEWSDLNRPLLRRLSLEAPGTYAHTMAIANLSETAANAIGANGLLTRVGAYYHDIGKLEKPQYFVENQAKGRNPHDKLKPSASAAIIRSHVKEGLELADEHKLPRAVKAFIPEHHGTNPIAYFLEKAKERDGAPANVAEYAYPGPVPQTAETAIVMLADGVEAAVRVLADPTPQRIRDVVDRIVRQRMDQGQLSAAPLTLEQLETVKDQFVRVLSGMHHARIDYPAATGGITSETPAISASEAAPSPVRRVP
jgi:putative nucleotidyltransferase with HDIG domain